eukprot:529985-Pelagomonas_calceolata.AAC.10
MVTMGGEVIRLDYTGKPSARQGLQGLGLQPETPANRPLGGSAEAKNQAFLHAPLHRCPLSGNLETFTPPFYRTEAPILPVRGHLPN